MLSRPIARQLAAELVGTFALVFAGCGAVMVDAQTNALGHVGVALTFGLVIMVMIYAVGHISGAHFNPAVTFAFVLSRHFPRSRAVGYWSAQLLGALAAAAILRGSLGNIADVGATLPSGSQRQSFLWELVLSFILMFVIMAVATDTRAVGEAAAIAIGGTVGLDAMFGGPISGASMNPARSIAPALVSGNLHALWLYILAPVLGASLGALAYQIIRGEATKPTPIQPHPRLVPPPSEPPRPESSADGRHERGADDRYRDRPRVSRQEPELPLKRAADSDE
jgi:MIP family channel proteins